MGAVELKCDVPSLHRLLDLMHRLGLRHDMRLVAFAVGKYVWDGNLFAALDLVRTELPRIAFGFTVVSLVETVHVTEGSTLLGG